MKIAVGFDMTYETSGPTPMMLTVSVHPSREPDLVEPEILQTDPVIPVSTYIDGFGNRCTRIVAPGGSIRLHSHAVINDSGGFDRPVPDVDQTPVGELPEETLVFLLGSRYCETDRLSDDAWKRFGHIPPGSARVKAIVEFVHKHIEFGYQHADSTLTAHGAMACSRGVCRDFTHLGVTLTRCMNIPARYCTGYVTDIGVPPPYAPMDFAAWFEAYFDGEWYTFDPRNFVPRAGRILMACGRDATDVAISNSFGPSRMLNFSVIAEAIGE
ncbi:MAG: transglutaminase-like domain-containing protein [Burkholderiaceae bacterium]